MLPRYYGWYANRTRGVRRNHVGPDGAEEQPPVVVLAPADRSRQEARRRWADLLRRIVEGDQLTGPRCGAEMRIIAFITDQQVSDRILAHETTLPLGLAIGCLDAWEVRQAGRPSERGRSPVAPRGIEPLFPP